MNCGIARVEGLRRNSKREVTMTAGTACSPFSPQTFASSDVDLEHRLANFLYQQRVPEAECIRLDARGGIVVVSGALSSQHAKWLCIECCRRVAGVLKVVDEVIVASTIVNFPKVDRIDGELRECSPGLRRKAAELRGPSLLHRTAIQQQRWLAAA
jgi:hypothetical protein